MFGWTPEYYNDTEFLPEIMPMRLKQHIEKVAEKNKNMVRREAFSPRETLQKCLFQLNTVWISCDGVYPADKEYIGPIKYYPFQGFPGYFYPYNGQDDYLSPLVAVHLEKPTRNYLVFCYEF